MVLGEIAGAMTAGELKTRELAKEAMA